MATTYDLTNATNLSPDYTNDPAAASSYLQQLQAELAQAQANPNDPNAAYYISQLTPAIQEQQNIVSYLNQQTAAKTASGTANYLGSIFSNIANGNGGNYNLVGTGDMKAVLQYLQQNNINPPVIGTFQTIQQLIQTAINGGKNAPTFGDVSSYLNHLNIPSQAINSIQSQVNNANQSLATDQSNVLNNLTFSQPNWQGANAAVDTIFAGLKNSQLNPEIQDIYATAYNNKMGTMDQLISAGMGNSGAAIKAKGDIDSKALSHSVADMSQFNNAQQQAHNALAQEAQQQQSAYQQALDATKSKDLGTLLAGSGNALGQSFNNNTSAATQTALNNAQSNLNSAQNNSNFLSGITSDIGQLAGTALAGPTGGLV